MRDKGFIFIFIFYFFIAHITRRANGRSRPKRNGALLMPNGIRAKPTKTYNGCLVGLDQGATRTTHMSKGVNVTSQNYRCVILSKYSLIYSKLHGENLLMILQSFIIPVL